MPYSLYNVAITAKCSLYALGTHFKFSFDEITEMVKQAEAMRQLVSSAGVPPPPVRAVGNKGTRITDLWLIHALEQHPIVDMHVVCEMYSCVVCVCVYCVGCGCLGMHGCVRVSFSFLNM